MCDCEQALALLSARLDGPLSPQEEQLLQAHLAACAACGAAAIELETLHGLMPQLLEEVPQGFHQRLMEKIAREQVLPFPAPQVKKQPWGAWGATAAVVALVIWGGGSLLQAGSGAPQVGAPAQMAALPAASPEASVQEDDTKTLGPQLESTAPGPFSQQTEDTLAPRAVLNILPGEEAALSLVEALWPGAAWAAERDGDGVLLRVQVETAEGAILVLDALGTSENGLYLEFQPSDQEQVRYAVALDGSGVLDRQTDPATYDAALSPST